jgi:hypothetical protein
MCTLKRKTKLERKKIKILKDKKEGTDRFGKRERRNR